MNQTRRIKPTSWIFIVGGLLMLLFVLMSRPSGIPDLEISQVLRMAEVGQVANIEVRGDRLNVITTGGDAFSSRKESSVSVLELLEQRDAFWWGGDSFANNDAPFREFTMVVRGYDPAHKGKAIGEHFATIDGGCGWGGTLNAACISADGAFVDWIEV